MSVTSPRVTITRVTARPDVRPAILVVAAVGVLLLRSWILRTPDATRIVLLVGVYGAVLAASLLAPVAPDRARLHPVAVLGLGLAAVGLAAVLGGRPAAAPLGATALPLALFAAVAEEALFRRAAYGWLERHGVALAVVGSALLFAAIHVPLYGAAAFPVDVGAGLLLSWQRWASGTWTVPAATHAAANLLAVMTR